MNWTRKVNPVTLFFLSFVKWSAFKSHASTWYRPADVMPTTSWLSGSSKMWMPYSISLQQFKKRIPFALSLFVGHWLLFGGWTVKDMGFQDGLRHSFGTYYHSLIRNIPEVVYVMGNSIEIAKRHYVREVSKEWMEKFWALKPTPMPWRIPKTQAIQKTPLKWGFFITKFDLSESCQKKIEFLVFSVLERNHQTIESIEV